MADAFTIETGAPAVREDGGHCECWWDCRPCCACGFDGGGADCDCPRHTNLRGKMTPEQIARVVHEANRAVQVEQADPIIPISPHWDDLDHETAHSAIDGVLGVIGGNTPEESHANWCKFKLDHGWCVGPVKDEAKKEHPLLVPYDELPESQKIKDHLFVAIVAALA